MSIFPAEKDGYFDGQVDAVSSTSLSMGGDGDTAFIRFAGLKIPQGSTITKAILKFRASGSNADTAQVQIVGSEDADTPSIWRDEFTESSLDRVHWWPYGQEESPILANGVAYLLSTCYFVNKIKLTGDFDIRARFYVNQGYEGCFGNAAIFFMAEDGTGGADIDVLSPRGSNGPIIGSYDVRLKRVGTTINSYKKDIGATTWGFVDQISGVTGPVGYCGIYMYPYVTVTVGTVAEITTQTLLDGASVYCSLTVPVNIDQINIATGTNLPGSFGGTLAAYAGAISNTPGTYVFKLTRSGSSVSLYYRRGAEAWSLITSMSYNSINCTTYLNVSTWTIESTNRVSCDFAQIGYIAPLQFYTDSEISNLVMES